MSESRRHVYQPIDTNCTHTLLPEESVYVIYPRERIRLMGTNIRKGFSSKQAQAFLDLHRTELCDLLDTTVKEFMKKRLG